MRSRLLLAPLLLLVASCSRPGRFSKASPWPEADRLFRQDSRWLGGDGAYSVPL
ncbi:MAG: hypothetical protein V3S11_02750 [Elusimicrobiota bacterium]